MPGSARLTAPKVTLEKERKRKLGVSEGYLIHVEFDLIRMLHGLVQMHIQYVRGCELEAFTSV